MEVQQEPSYIELQHLQISTAVHHGSSPCKSSPELRRYLHPQIGGRPEKQVQNE